MTAPAAHQQKPVDEMTIREVVIELHETPNPTTGKVHTLTEIARIAGASKGWTAMVMTRGESGNANSRSASYGPNLRRYLRTLRGDRKPKTEEETLAGLGIRRRPKAEHDARQEAGVVKLDVQLRDDLPPLPRGALSDVPVAPLPKPLSQGVNPVLPQPRVTVAENGARIVDKRPPAPPPPEPKVPFMERFERLQSRLWGLTTEIDDLEKEAPALFKSGVSKLRDDLMTILQQLEG